uniref:Phage protein n=1 Tax=Strongyloides venezuelensis TaxID=75913 RepID=A0A0K0F6T9_STRVS
MNVNLISKNVKISEDGEACTKEERISILAKQYIDLLHIAQNKEDDPRDLDNTIKYELVNQEDVNLAHLTYDFLEQENIKDRYGKRLSDPEYD